MQKLDDLKHFCFFETKGLGFSYKLSQLLSAQLPHKIFEATVTPSGSILVIAFQDKIETSQMIQWIERDAEIASAIKSWHLSLNTNAELIDGYLNQIMRPISGRLVIVEGFLFAAVFPVIESLIEAGLIIAEFRLLRSHQNHFCVSFTTTIDAKKLEQIVSNAIKNIDHPNWREAVHVSLIPLPSDEIKGQYAF